MTISVKQDEYIWAQKYRPSTISECVLTPTMKKTFEKIVEDGEVFNLLLSSKSPGTGKTTVARALSNDLECDMLFINASEDNGIDTLRNTIKGFASSMSLSGGDKLIILDEADNLTDQAQKALRGLMEEFSSNARFIITCNYKNRVIEAIRSRCKVIDFAFKQEDMKPLQANMFKRCISILGNEGVEYDKEALAKVVVKYAPDNRTLLNELQSYAIGNDNKIDLGILGALKNADSKELVGMMRSKKFGEIRQWVETNSSIISHELYTRLYESLYEHVQDSSKPILITILGDEQKWHDTVPDVGLHVMSTLTKILCEVEFKE